MQTYLQLVQRASGELGLAVPNAVASSTSQDVIQLGYLANACGKELMEEYEWQGIDKEYRFTTDYVQTTGTLTDGSPIITGIPDTTGLADTYMVIAEGVNQDTYVLTVDSSSQVTMSQNATASGSVAIYFCQTKYSLPADFDRLIDRTQWDKSKHWEMLGPSSAQSWQWLKSGYISTGPRIRFRMLGGYFQIWPALASDEYLGFEYMSNYWAQDSNGDYKAEFTADDDTCIFPDRLMTLFLKKKYFEAKGFDTTALERDFQRVLNQSKAQDGGSQTLSFAPQPSSILITWANIPDSGYGN